MDAMRDYHMWSKSEKDKYYMTSLIRGSKIGHKWTSLWNRNIREQTYRQGEVGVREGWTRNLGLADRCKLFHLEWMNKNLLYSTGNYIQSPRVNHNGKEYFNKNIYMCKKNSSIFNRPYSSWYSSKKNKNKKLNLYTYIHIHAYTYINTHIYIYLPW